MSRSRPAIVSTLPLDTIGGGEAFTLDTHSSATAYDMDLCCAVQLHKEIAPQSKRITPGYRYRRLITVDGIRAAAEEIFFADLLRRLAGYETVAIQQYLASLATLDILAAAPPWQRHV